MSSLTHNQRNMVFVEVCCERGSALACEAKRLGIPYMGITQDMESESTQTAVSQYLNQYRDPKKVFVHVSSPCASGSPLRHFKGNNEPTSVDFDWDRIFPHVGFYLKLGDCSSFEPPWRNEIWNWVLTKETLRKAGHLFDVQVHLCATGFRTASGKAVGKSLGFTSNSRPFVMIMNQNFGQCKCVASHAVMNEVNWSETARYNTTLARGILKAAMKALEAT